uniref:Uncharacterized protein n=1 Tax=Biomphalaria glabrata TaxID=6526 RepID=A0A2C9KQ31_BIOGL
MADEPILGLFDGETNFLDELAATGSNDLGPTTGMGGGSLMGGSNSGMPGTQHLQQSGQSQQGMMIGSQGLASNMSGNYASNMGQDVSGYNLQCSQPNLMTHQQYGGDQYVQFSNPMPKIGHSQGIMMGSQQQQGPFSPNLPGGMIQQQAGYTGYNIGPHSHAQQQPIPQMTPMMSPNSGWNQSQPSPNQQTQSHPLSQFMAPNAPQTQMSPYINQGFHSQQMSQINQYNPNNKMAASNSSYIIQPNPMQGGMASSQGNMNMMGSISVRASHPNYPSHQVSPASQHSTMMQGNYNSPMNQVISGPVTSQYSGDIMPTHVPNQMNSSNMGQHYPQYTSNQQLRPEGGGALSHYTNQNAAPSYGPPYQTISQPRPNSSTPSPRPTPPPQSMTPNHNSSTQGNYGQTSLQQLEQLVSPNLAGTNPYQQLMQPNSSSPTGNSNMQCASQQGPIYSFTNFPTTTVCSTVTMPQGGNVQSVAGPQIQMNIQGQIPMQNSNNLGNYQGQNPMMQNAAGPLSPNQSMLPQNQMALEIQRLEQQLQQLVSMPHTQQQMLEVQERLRLCRSQYQMHMQPQQHHQPIQPSSMPGGKIIPQHITQIIPQPQQQIGQVPQIQIRPIRGATSNIQPSSMNSQPILQQKVPSQLTGPVSNRSVPSPQKVQPFQLHIVIIDLFPAAIVNIILALR